MLSSPNASVSLRRAPLMISCDFVTCFDPVVSTTSCEYSHLTDFDISPELFGIGGRSDNMFRPAYPDLIFNDVSLSLVYIMH